MTRTQHKWFDKSSPATFCKICGCDRTVTRPDDIANLAAGRPFNRKPAYTREGWPYSSRGPYTPYRYSDAAGLCDAQWPAGWIPENAHVGFVTPHGDVKREFFDAQARLHMRAPNTEGI